MFEIKFYLKIHSRGKESCIGVCDEDCLGRVLEEGELKFKVSNYFFEGELVDLENVLRILKRSYNYNVVGKNICEAMIEEGILHAEGIKEIEGIPIAIKFVM